MAGTILTESLKRIYRNGNVTEERLRQMFLDGKLSEEELGWILEVDRELQTIAPADMSV